jgi:ribonuclease-3 family protein
MNTKLINIQVLALLGDAIYSLYIREKLIEVGYNDIEKIQKKQVEYVSAKGEVKVLNYLIDNNLLTNDELDIVKRGRNYKNNSHPKNTDIITYKLSTGFESLLGDLYLNNNERLYEILNLIEVTNY